MNLFYLKEGVKCFQAYDGFMGNMIQMLYSPNDTTIWEKQVYRNKKPLQTPISIPGWNGCEQLKFSGNFFSECYTRENYPLNSLVFDPKAPMEILRCDQYAIVGLAYMLIDRIPRYVPIGTYTKDRSVYQVLGQFRTLPEATSYYGGAKMFYPTRDDAIRVITKYGLLKGPITWPGRYLSSSLVIPTSTGRISNRSLNDFLSKHVPYPLPASNDLSLEFRNQLLDSAMSSFERLATMRLALEIMSDGLVVQAASQLGRTVSSLLSSGAGRSLIRQNGQLIEQTTSKAKQLSQAYMTYNWGIRAPLGDYGKLLSLLAKGDYYNQINNPYFVGRANTTIRDWDVSVVAGCQVDMSAMDSIASTLYFLHKYGYDLTANDLWQVVPLSFAVDWLVDVSSWLSSLERSFVYENFPIRGSWLTLKGVAPLHLTGFMGSGIVTHYTRGDMPSRFLPSRDEYKPIFSLTGRFRVSNLDDALALGTSFFG